MVVTLSSLLQRCELTKSDVQIVVDEKSYSEVARCFTYWREVAPLCGIKTNEIDDIELDYRTEQEKRVGFLKTWKKRSAYEATYFCLIQALLKISEADEAWKVCTHLKGCLTECAGATGTSDLTSLDLNDVLEKRSDTQNRTSVNGSEPKHGSSQLETSKTLFQSPKGTQEDYRTGLGMDHTDEGDIDKENLKRSDPRSYSPSNVLLREVKYSSGMTENVKVSYNMECKFKNILVQFSLFLEDEDFDISKITWVLEDFVQKYPPIEKHKQEKRIDFEGLKNVSSLMKLIDTYCSFFNFKILETLMNLTKFEDGKKLMESYKKEFADYLKQITVRETPSKLGICSKEKEVFAVKLDEGFKNCRAYYLDVLREDLSRILNIKEELILIDCVRPGSVWVVFHLPVSSQKALQLNDQHLKQLKDINYDGMKILQIQHEEKTYIIHKEAYDFNQVESEKSCKQNLAEGTSSGQQFNPKSTTPEDAQVSTKFLTDADPTNAVASSSDDYLRQELYLLKKKFEVLLYEFELSLQERRIDVIQIKKYLKLIPIAENLQLKHCVPNFSMIFRANSIRELLFVLAPCWDYLHLGLLKHLIHKFGSEKNKQNLQNYSTYLEKFRCKVSVGNFIRVCNKMPENISEFYYVHLMAEMDKKWETVTLQEVEKLRLELRLESAMNMCCSEHEKPPFTDNEPTSGLGKNPKSLMSLAELVLKQGSEELNEYSGESTGKQESSKQSSTCKHDYQKGLLKGQSSSTHSLTMGSLLPSKGQDLLKHEVISQPDVPKMSSLENILMLRRALHIRYLSLAITTYKYTGRLTSDVSIEYDSTNNKFTVVSSDGNSWLLEPLQRDLKNLSEQPELKVTETDFVQDVIERTDYYVMSNDLEFGNLEEVVLLNYMSIMKIRKWEQQTRFPSFDTFEPLYLDFSMEKQIHRICKTVVEKHVGSVKETRHVRKHFHFVFRYLMNLIREKHVHKSFEHYLLKQELFVQVMTFTDNLEELKAAQLMLLLVDQITIAKFISEHTVHWNTYLEFMEVLHS